MYTVRIIAEELSISGLHDWLTVLFCHRVSSQGNMFRSRGSDSEGYNGRSKQVIGK
jgi:hypothetical protein